ncbi:VOC family protein [Microvirga sp. BT350]|uniref:VOC family protein n=1 Tax=Microvirga alba TaxID=2791025 RepID=A0A931BN27_9HYPH|nr:VOC family protein [Microvirga alba]
MRDLAHSRAFYVETLGMLVSNEDPDTLYLRGVEEAAHHSLVLKRSVQTGCERLGFRVFTEEDLDLLSAHFVERGLPLSWVEAPFQSRTLHVTDEIGVPLEFCASMKVMERAINRFDQHTGACPLRLDHMQVLTPAVERACAIYGKMGFRTSEYIADEGTDALRAVFMQRKGNPHDIVFMRNDGPRLHHVAFTCPEAHHLLHLCDLLAAAGFGRSVEWGPGRHFGPGYARFVYLRDPDGHRVEFFNNHYQTIDIEDEPLRWVPPSKGEASRWGRLSPPSWREEATAFV